MALRSGLAAQIGFAAETTWGTYQIPTRFLEFVSEGMALSIERIESSAIRRNNRVLRSDRWIANKKGVGGAVSFEVSDKGFGLLFKHMLGTAAAPATPGGATNTRDHVFTIGDHDGLALTVQVGRPDVGGTTRAFSYMGCKVTEWEISNSVDGLLALSLTFDGRDEDTGQTLATASYPSDQGLLSYVGGTISVGGSSMDVSDISISGSNGLKTDRHFIRSETRKKEQVPTEMVELSGSLSGEFEDLTAYNRFVNGTTAAVSAVWAGREIETNFNYTVQVDLPVVRFDGDTPNVGGTDIIEQSLPFKVLNNGTDEPIEITYRTTDTSA
jgi:hypothetical protein